jgi:hypothetical protein
VLSLINQFIPIFSQNPYDISLSVVRTGKAPSLFFTLFLFDSFSCYLSVVSYFLLPSSQSHPLGIYALSKTVALTKVMIKVSLPTNYFLDVQFFVKIKSMHMSLHPFIVQIFVLHYCIVVFFFFSFFLSFPVASSRSHPLAPPPGPGFKMLYFDVNGSISDGPLVLTGALMYPWAHPLGFKWLMCMIISIGVDIFCL